MAGGSTLSVVRTQRQHNIKALQGLYIVGGPMWAGWRVCGPMKIVVKSGRKAEFLHLLLKLFRSVTAPV